MPFHPLQSGYKNDRFHLNNQKEHAAQARQYAAAKTGRLNSDWIATSSGMNELLRGSAAMVRYRTRQLCRDFPYFKRAKDVITAKRVGSGIVCQPRIRRLDDPLALDEPLINEIEELWQRSMEEMHRSRQLHFYELQKLASDQHTENGEYLGVWSIERDRRRVVPFNVEFYDAEWLTELHTQFNTKVSAIDMGVEYSRVTGEPLAYHFQDPENLTQPRRLEADRVVHGYEFQRPGQRRGISPMAAAVLIARDLGDYMGAEIDAAKMAAKWLAFVTRPDAMSSTVPGLATAQNAAGEQIYVEELENAIIEYLQPGEQVQMQSNARPSGNFEPFIMLIVRMISIVTNVSFELISGDYRGLNFNALRGSRNDMMSLVKPDQTRFVRGMCENFYRAWMDAAVLSGALSLSLERYEARRWHYQRAAWMLPGQDFIDPLRETKAAVDQIAKRIQSPIAVMHSLGRDPRQVVHEIKQWQDMLKREGISLEEVSTAMKQNPDFMLSEDGDDDAPDDTEENAKKKDRLYRYLEMN